MIIAKKGGGGGGSSGREWSDNVLSIDYAKVLDLISEGPIKGLVNGQEGIIIDDVRVKGSNGNVNIQGINTFKEQGNNINPILKDLQHLKTRPLLVLNF